MRLHIVGLPWTETTSAYPTCAYTGKVARFGPMMLAQGHEVILYAGEENEAECTEHVPLVSREERVRWFGEHDNNTLWGHLTWNPTDEWWHKMNTRAIMEIEKRLGDNDIICLITSHPQKIIHDYFKLRRSPQDPRVRALVCEPFVGYDHTLADLVVYESYAWMHTVYARQEIHDGRNYDAVIPNYFDPDEFHTDKKGDYLLFVGRLIERKGPHIAARIAERVGMPLVVAGPGGEMKDGVLHGLGFTATGDIEYVGPVNQAERADLMAGARALLAPTQYIGPFEGVSVEAMLCGTPAITTDWGVFPETVETGVTGYRFRTLQEGADAVEKAIRLGKTPARRERIRQHAISKYGLDAVGAQFHAYFNRAQTLYGEGWTT